MAADIRLNTGNYLLKGYWKHFKVEGFYFKDVLKKISAAEKIGEIIEISGKLLSW